MNRVCKSVASVSTWLVESYCELMIILLLVQWSTVCIILSQTYMKSVVTAIALEFL